MPSIDLNCDLGESFGLDAKQRDLHHLVGDAIGIMPIYSGIFSRVLSY